MKYDVQIRSVKTIHLKNPEKKPKQNHCICRHDKISEWDLKQQPTNQSVKIPSYYKWTMFPEYMHLRQRSHDISNSSIYIHVYYTCNNSSSSPSSRYQPRHIPYWFKFFFNSKEIFFNIERNDMLIQNICYLSVITILNCQLPDCNENMKKN